MTRKFFTWNSLGQRERKSGQRELHIINQFLDISQPRGEYVSCLMAPMFVFFHHNSPFSRLIFSPVVNFYPGYTWTKDLGI
jgi:hypothetical protein